MPSVHRSVYSCRSLDSTAGTGTGAGTSVQRKALLSYDSTGERSTERSASARRLRYSTQYYQVQARFVILNASTHNRTLARHARCQLGAWPVRSRVVARPRVLSISYSMRMRFIQAHATSQSALHEKSSSHDLSTPPHPPSTLGTVVPHVYVYASSCEHPSASLADMRACGSAASR